MKIFNNIYDEKLHDYLKDLKFITDPQIIGKDKIETYIKLSLDNNPVHIDPELARQSSFEEPVVHGPLQAIMATGWIHHILQCRDYTYPKQIWFLIYNYLPMPVGTQINYVYSVEEMVLRNDPDKDPYLKVIYLIEGYVEGKKVIKLKWYIRYETSKFLLKNKRSDS